MYNNKRMSWMGTVTAALMLSGCGGSSDSTPEITAPPPTPVPAVENVKIDYTSYGVPHITASSYTGMAYGQGYTHAQDNMCTLAEQIVNVRAQRAQTFGAGEDNSNLDADFGILALGVYQQAQDTLGSLSEEHTQLLQGYVKGFNAGVAAKQGAENYPLPCRGAEWVPEISVTDLHAFHLRLALLASGDAVGEQIALAAPLTQTTSVDESLHKITEKNKDLGSNGWALGKDKTESGNGMLLSNPHFPWLGHLRFVQSHLQIPGELNVTGVAFVGVPVVLIGFNENLAWTHTVSQSKRMTIYNLELDPENSLRYRYGQEYRDITGQEYSIQVKAEDGSLQQVSRTLYFSHYGPMLGWMPNGTALTFRDANANNINIVPHWLDMNKATNLVEFKKAFVEHQGIPWVNTMATDDQGNAFYIDAARTAYLNPAVDVGLKQVLTNPATDATSQALHAQWEDGEGQIVLNGSEPIFEWVESAATPVPGTVPYHLAPQATRTDYVFNANSSHWLTNVGEPIEGHSIVYGPERTIRSPRTRMNAKMLEEVTANGASGIDGKFSRQELKNVVTNNRSMTAELIKAQLVARCAGKGEINLAQGEVVDIAPACDVLSNWDGFYHNESVGAHVFRQFAREFRTGTERVLSDDLFENAFDPAQPVATPFGLKSLEAGQTDDEDPILVALANTVTKLKALGYALDAKLGDLQHHMKNDERIAIPGGGSSEGVFNINAASAIPGVGYYVYHGASWVMALEFTEAGPVADAWLTYGQSHDPESEHFSDQTHLYSRGEWRPVLFTDEAIQNDVKSSITLEVK